jgi:hypothetical protein
LRAADQRINPYSAACCPEHVAFATRPSVPGYEPGRHEVTITAKLVRELTYPVSFTSSHSWDNACKILGISYSTLKAMIKRGQFEVSYVKNWSGRWGHPVPFVRSDELLDPCRGRGREMIDPLWGTSWKYIAENTPDDLEQTLVRVPHFIAGSTKWKHTKKSFMGWHWECPGCKRPVRVIYYPLSRYKGVRFIVRAMRHVWDDEQHPDHEPPAMPTFACGRCHNVMMTTRSLPDWWNRLVSHHTCGLLYGSDVPMLKGLVKRRLRPFHPHLRREPSRRRELVLRDILAGLSYRQIMRKQAIAKSTVSMHALTLYKQHRVKGPAGLRALHARRPLIAEVEMTNTETRNPNEARMQKDE